MGQTIYHNGDIVTVNDAQPTAEAVLVSEGKILAVGSLEDVKKVAGPTTAQIDLQGKTMVPGFVDGHSHIIGSANFPKFSAPPIGDVDSVEKLIASAKGYLAKHPVKPGGWFMGMGYDEAAYPDHHRPTREDLDQISEEIPIFFLHASGHVGTLNSKGLEVAGITKDTPAPEGGVIQRDPETGEPTGVVEEAVSMGLAMKINKERSFDDQIEAVKRAQEKYFSYGITTAQNGGGNANMTPMLEYLQDHDVLDIDVYSYPFINSSAKATLEGIHSKTQIYKNHVKIAGAKLVLDGSPQAKTAWMTKPYYVVPEGEAEDYRGYPAIPDDDEVCGYFKECLKNGWQVLVHCNGDAALDQFIAQYTRAQEETGITDDLRPVVIHCQTVREDQLDRMKEIGMLPSFFHDHTYYWGDWHMDSVFGTERGSRISPLASAVKRGTSFTLHQDTPIVPPNMIFTLHNAVNRKTASGRDIGPEFAISPMEALRAITIYGAYQCFEESSKGTIEPGKRADLVILDKNPLKVPKTEIRDIHVLETIKDGQVVYREETDQA